MVKRTLFWTLVLALVWGWDWRIAAGMALCQFFVVPLLPAWYRLWGWE